MEAGKDYMEYDAYEDYLEVEQKGMSFNIWHEINIWLPLDGSLLAKV